MSKLKVTILSLSLVTVMAGAAVSPALGAIAEYFMDADPLLIKLIVTLPALSIIVTSMLFGTIANRFASKTIAIVGLLLYIGGVAAGLTDNIYMILGLRIVQGVGVGLIMPLSTGLLAYFFDSREHSKLLGYSVAMNNLGGVIATILAGYLVSLNWRYAFAINLLGLIIMILVILYLPKVEITRKKVNMSLQTIRKIGPYLFPTFFMMLIYTAVPANFSIILTQNELVPTAYIGALMALLNVAAFTGGLMVSKIVKLTAGITQYIVNSLLVTGFIALSFTDNLGLAVVGLLAVGACIGIMAPIINTQIAMHVEKEQITSAMALASAMLFLGQFLSPIVMDAIQSIFHWQSIQAPYYLAMIFAVILCISYVKIPITLVQTDTN